MNKPTIYKTKVYGKERDLIRTGNIVRVRNCETVDGTPIPNGVYRVLESELFEDGDRGVVVGAYQTIQPYQETI